MMKIYGVPLSVHTRKVIVVCRIKEIPFEVVPVVPVVPEQVPPNWRSISPTGLIPAIDDGGFVLADSTAIALYLERKAPVPSLLPTDLEGYGRALFLDAWAGRFFSRVIHPLFHNQIVAPQIRKTTPDEAAIRLASGEASEAFSYLESLEPGPFLVGGRLSLADVAIVSNLIMFHYLGHRIDEARYPRTKGYFRRHLEDSHLRAALEAERPFAQNLQLQTSF